jgi:hypothetical protein
VEIIKGSGFVNSRREEFSERVRECRDQQEISERFFRQMSFRRRQEPLLSNSLANKHVATATVELQQ